MRSVNFGESEKQWASCLRFQWVNRAWGIQGIVISFAYVQQSVFHENVRITVELPDI